MSGSKRKGVLPGGSREGADSVVGGDSSGHGDEGGTALEGAAACSDGEAGGCRGDHDVSCEWSDKEERNVKLWREK